jgi:hypothetical protein
MTVAAFKPPLIDASDDPTQNLQAFGLLDLVQFTRERTFSNNASKDFHLFFVGRDERFGCV